MRSFIRTGAFALFLICMVPFTIIGMVTCIIHMGFRLGFAAMEKFLTIK